MEKQPEKSRTSPEKVLSVVAHYSSNIAVNVKRLRLQAGLTHGDLAYMFRSSTNIVRRAERNDATNNFELYSLARYCDFFNVTLSDLLKDPFDGNGTNTIGKDVHS